MPEALTHDQETEIHLTLDEIRETMMEGIEYLINAGKPRSHAAAIICIQTLMEIWFCLRTMIDRETLQKELIAAINQMYEEDLKDEKN